MGIWYISSYCVTWIEPTGSLKPPNFFSFWIIIVRPPLLVRATGKSENFMSLQMELWKHSLFLFKKCILPHGFCLKFLVNVGVQGLQLWELPSPAWIKLDTLSNTMTQDFIREVELNSLNIPYSFWWLVCAVTGTPFGAIHIITLWIDPDRAPPQLCCFLVSCRSF